MIKDNWLKPTVIFIFVLQLGLTCTWATGQVQCDYGGSTLQQNVCAVRDYKRADAELNKKYRATFWRLPTAKRQVLRQEQRTWVRKRDPYCLKKTEDFKGGSGWTVQFFDCLETITEQRTAELERYR